MSDKSPDLVETVATSNTVLTHSSPLWNLPCHKAKCLESLLYLEMASIKYQRKICKYNINYFVEELELPMLRHNMQTTRSVIDFCEGIGHQQTNVVGRNNGLNSWLEFPQQADVSALQSLIRDRLNLVFLHQLYANEANWNEYCKQMGHYLPVLLRRFLLNKERQYGLKILTRNQVITEKNAKELLVDCLHVIFMKMNGGKNNGHHHIHDIIEINQQNKDESQLQYFFGSQPTSLDAVLCAELILLESAQIPNKYLNDVKKDPKVKYLLKYAKRIMEHYHASIFSKLTPENEIEPIEILRKPKDFTRKQSQKSTKSPPKFYTKYIDTDEKKGSLAFVVGSVAAFALYWRFFQPFK